MIALVSFNKEGTGKQYAYFNDEPLAIGDVVVVPLGKDNREQTAYVTNVNPTGEEAKWASKSIIRKATQEVK